MEHKIKLQLILIMLCCTVVAGSASAKVYRWVDENGEVHYSESLPPTHVDKGHDVLNERGILLDEDIKLTPPPPPPPAEITEEEQRLELPRDSSGLPRPKPLYTDSEKQERMDKLLLLRYASVEDIETQLAFELSNIEHDAKMLMTSKNSLLKSYRGQIREAADLQRSGKPVSQEATRAIANLNSRLEKSLVQVEELGAREENTRAEFQQRLDRYRLLEEKWAADNPGS
jgi:hypothetical protein